MHRRLEIDLGGIAVQLWYFGPGNAPGDTIVYVPSAKVAWTGNYLMAEGVPPMLLEGGTGPYLASLEKFQATLDVDTIVPGHGPMGRAGPAVDNFIAYMHELHDRAQRAIDDGLDLDAAVDAFPMSPSAAPARRRRAGSEHEGDGAPPSPAQRHGRVPGALSDQWSALTDRWLIQQGE